MRKIKIGIAALICISSSFVWALGPAIIGSPSQALRDAAPNYSSPNSAIGFGYTGAEYQATRFQAGSTYNTAETRVELSKSGSPTGALSAHLYSNNVSDEPGTLLGDAGATLDISTLAAWATEYTFTFSGVALSSGTKYWIVLHVDSGSLDGSNFVQWHYNSSDTSGLSKHAGAGWASDGTMMLAFQTWGK